MQANKYWVGLGVAWLCCLTTARALTIDSGQAVNVTPSQFDLFVRTSEPATTWVAVFADAGGQTNLAGTVGLETDPVHTGDPLQTTNYYRRSYIRNIQSAASAKSVALHRVSGCNPETTYYVRVFATNQNGSAQWPASGLLEVSTEKENSFLMESRQLLVDLHPSVSPPDPMGAVGILEVAGASAPIASIVGDGAVSNQVYFDLGQLFSASDHRNMAFSNAPTCTVTIYGQPEMPDLSAEFTIPFSNLTQVAKAEYAEMIRSFILDIRSIHGQVNPGVGLYTNVWGTEVSCAITNAAIVNGTTQQVFTGWALTGDQANTNATGTALVFTQTNNAVLTWNWKTQYWLDTDAGAGGQVDKPDQWVDAGDVITITAQPNVYYHVDSWTGDTTGTTISGDAMTVPMTQARAIFTFFAENISSNGVPEQWFVEQGLVGDWRTIGLLDQDHDGMLSWQEYVAGTSPTNKNDVLKMDMEVHTEGNSSMLVWSSVSNRVYKVWRSTDLTEGFRQVSGNLQATPPVNTFNEPQMPVGQPVFYRISVEKK
jgi:hypothetical protein